MSPATLSEFAADFVESSLPEAIVYPDLACRLLLVNAAFNRQFGHAEVPLAASPPDYLAAVKSELPSGPGPCYCDRTRAVDVVIQEDCMLQSLHKVVLGSSEKWRAVQLSLHHAGSVRRYVARIIEGEFLPSLGKLILATRIVDPSVFELAVHTTADSSGEIELEVTAFQAARTLLQQRLKIARDDERQYFEFRDVLLHAAQLLGEGRSFAAGAFLERMAGWYRSQAHYGYFLLGAVLDASPASELREQQLREIAARILDAPRLVWEIVPKVASQACAERISTENIIINPAFQRDVRDSVHTADSETGGSGDGHGDPSSLGIVLTSLEILDKNELQVAIREHDARYGGPTVPPGQERDYLTDLAFHYARTASDKLIDLDRILSHIELDSLVSTH